MSPVLQKWALAYLVFTAEIASEWLSRHLGASAS